MKYLYFILFVIISAFVFCSETEPVETDFKALLSEWSEKAKASPSYAYPYHNLAEQLTQEGKDCLVLFSYGSLMDVKSAERTLSAAALKTRRPAVGFGLKRLFNLDVPVMATSRWGIPKDSKARGMLNVHRACTESLVNGVLIDVPLSDVHALLEREIGYDLVPIAVADWSAFLQGQLEFSIAYTLVTPKNSEYTAESIYPRPGYYELVRDAAREFGPLFSLLWANTTYLSDGNTSITVWEHWVQRNDARTQKQLN